MAESGSLTVYPQEYDQSDYSYASITGASDVVGKGSDSTSRLQMQLKVGSGAESYIYIPFDLSAIPNEVKIDSVLCKATGYVSASSQSRISSATFQLFSGSTAKGSATSFRSTAKTVYTLSVGTWTRSELANCKLKIAAKRGSSDVNSAYLCVFYGADLTVTYTYQSEKFMLKLSGSYEDVARTFKKVNGVWVEVDDLSTAVDTSKKLVNGGEITS